MSGFLDTSVAVRYLTNDPPDLAQSAAAIIDTTDTLDIDRVIIAEIAYVLGSVYQRPRTEIVDVILELLHKDNVSPWGLAKADVISALLTCRDSNRVSFAD